MLASRASARASGSRAASGDNQGNIPSGRRPVRLSMRSALPASCGPVAAVVRLRISPATSMCGASGFPQRQCGVVDGPERRPRHDQQRKLEPRGDVGASHVVVVGDEQSARPFDDEEVAVGGERSRPCGDPVDVDALPFGGGRLCRGPPAGEVCRGRPPLRGRVGEAACQSARASAGCGSQPVSAGLKGIGVIPWRRPYRSSAAETVVFPTPGVGFR